MAVPNVDIKTRRPEYAVDEAYKSVRTNLQFCGSDYKVIAMTSCTPGEGKSTVCLNLAMSLSENGKKVLLVDADLRKSVLMGRTRVSRKLPGLAHYLSGQAALQDVICVTNVPNLDIIYAGPIPPNPAELLAGKNFQTLLESLRDSYDYILVDAPPLGSVIDGAIIAEKSDGSILVIEAGAISFRVAQEVVGQLKKSNRPILGVILNKVDISKQPYGKYKKYAPYTQTGAAQG